MFKLHMVASVSQKKSNLRTFGSVFCVGFFIGPSTDQTNKGLAESQLS